MRLTTVILFVTIMQVSATGYAQKLTLNNKKISIALVFQEINKQTGYDVFYLAKIINTDKTIQANFTNAHLDDVMKVCLEGQPLTYTIDQKTIVIKQKEESFHENSIARFQQIDVTGSVVNELGQPLVGATVRVKGTSKSVKTGQDGAFILLNVEVDDKIVISHIGYESKELMAKSNLSVTTLSSSNSKLDEVQIIAYGQTSQRLSTGNVSTVKAADIEKSPVNNPLLALAGRVPGIFITQSTGFAGTGVQVQIQGQNSIANGTVPFYVVDGVPYTQNILTTLSGIQGSSNAPVGGGTSNPLSFINPQDIESIEVLKDADATSIYGSRASNGAILITTKKGKPGKTNISLNMQTGFGEVGKKLSGLNTEQYLALRQEAYQSQGLPVPTANSVKNPTNYDLTHWDQNRYTDWQEELIGGQSRYSDIQGAISGGNVNTQILLGVNYHHETTVMPGDLSDQKAGVHFNMNHSSVDQRFKVSMTGNYNTDKNRLPAVDLTSAAIRMAPNAPALYGADGKLNWEPLPSGVESWNNPLIGIVRNYISNSNNIIGSAEAGYRIWNSLTFKSTFGYNKLSTDELLLIPQTAFAPSVTGNSRSAVFSTKISTGWIIEPQLTYNLVTKYGKVDFLAGTTFQRSNSYLMGLNARGYSNDAQLADIAAATDVSVQNSIQDTTNYNAVFARISYNLMNTYLLNVTVRRDGSSRFGSENLFNNFYGLGAAWIFTEENWMKTNMSFLSFGKLKLSYGTTGNDQIGNYTFMSRYTTPYIEVPYGGGPSLRVNRLSNPYLQWEETEKLNAGLDLGFLSDRILLNMNYYRNRSSNQLTRYVLPFTTGFAGIDQNFPALVQNSGVEIALNTELIKGKNLKWKSGFNISVPRNKLVKFENLATSSYANRLVIGESLSIWKTVNYLGVNTQTGRYNFERADGSVTESAADRILMVDRAPRFYGGLQNSFSFKGFSLDFLFQFTKQTGLDETRFGYGSSPGSFSSTNGTGNQPASILGNYWVAPDDVAEWQRLNPGVTSLTTPWSLAQNNLNHHNWVDASYIRLKNAYFSYALPQHIVRKVKLQNFKIYAQGQNLFTITKYKGLDPESLSSYTLPPLRVITFGVQLSI